MIPVGGRWPDWDSVFCNFYGSYWQAKISQLLLIGTGPLLLDELLLRSSARGIDDL